MTDNSSLDENENDTSIKVNIYTSTSTRQPDTSSRNTQQEIKISQEEQYHPRQNINPQLPISQRNRPSNAYDRLLNLLFAAEYLQSLENGEIALEFIMGDPNDGELLRDENIVLNIQQRESKASELGEPCCICMSPFKINDIVSELQCAHVFHNECIQEWGKHKQVCPLCRIPIPTVMHT